MRVVVAVLLLFLPASLFAWHTNTHLQMTRDAISLMPPDFKKIFEDHKKYTENGITDPDLILKDWQNHYYIPSNPPEGGALDRIDKIISIVRMKLKNSTAPDASKQLCYLAHYIGDLWSPESVIKRDTASDLDFFQNNTIFVVYEGLKGPIPDLGSYLKDRSAWRWKLEDSKTVSTLLYSEAVNDIARVWLTLWQESGKDVAPQTGLILEHKPGVLQDNLMRYLSRDEANELHGGWYHQEWHEYDDYSYSDYDLSRQRAEYQYHPSESQLYGKVIARNEKQLLSMIRPDAPFQFLEVSLKTLGNENYFVARVRNASNQEIPSIAFLAPGVKGALALIKALKPGQVRKLDAVLPVSVTKDQIQVVFSATE